VTKGDATEFIDYLMRPTKAGGVGLKESTARKRYVHATSFFKHAALKGIISVNPFDDNGVVKTNLAGEEYFFLPVDDAQRIIDALPTAQLKLLFGLARWAGLRVGSEPRALKWSDIDWQGRTMLIHAKKTKRHKGKGQRVCPLFPELVPLLEARRAEAGPDDIYVLPFLHGRSDASLRDFIERAAKKAGVEMWPRMWQKIRSTRQTELEDRFPSHVVCKWLGNSAKIAEKHYLRVNGSHYSAAADWATPRTSQNPSHTTPIWSTFEAQGAPANAKNPGKSSFATKCSGQGGIRTPGEFPHAGFQDRCIRPLCHLTDFATACRRLANPRRTVRSLPGKLAHRKPRSPSVNPR